MKLPESFLRSFFIVALLNFCAAGHSQVTLSLIPQPKQVEIFNGFFDANPNIKVGIGNYNDTATFFAANQLLETLADNFPGKYVLTDKPHRATILLGIMGRDAFISKLNKAGILSLPDEAKAEGYLLKILNDKIIVVAYTEAGLFYGVQTLKQLIKGNADSDKLPCLSITDWPSLRYRGWMDDISRGPIPTMDFLKECIRKMAEYKQNFFTLYTEHVFKLREYPDIAPADGITAEQIEELTRYTSTRYLRMIARNPGPLPASHQAAGYPSYIFADEIIIE